MSRLKSTARVLVVGAGLTGLIAAWLSARAGYRTVVVDEDRPGTRESPLAVSVVHGFGPPADPFVWCRMTPREHRAEALRSEIGYARFREALFLGSKSVRLRRAPHRLLAWPGSDGRDLEIAGERLAAAGLPVALREDDVGVALERGDEALVARDRLAADLARQAESMGVDLRTPDRVFALEEDPGGGVLAEVMTGRERFDACIWAGSRPWNGARAGLRHRAVLYEEVEAGALSLPAILQLASADGLFAPDAGHGARHVIVRLASETSEPGLRWPEIPGAWATFRGATRRQRLMGAFVGPSRRSFTRRSGVVSLTGLEWWPIASVFGAAAEALGLPPCDDERLEST